ncbi:hypothetical protein Syun_004799 [Stephania yunnanensis]|uniref:TF-B3 domain-containing protein n=1 Tax=Stephania yunnanensis TaxID=152371 RepID=A0AAP0Q160_9MAGN
MLRYIYIYMHSPKSDNKNTLFHFHKQHHKMVEGNYFFKCMIHETYAEKMIIPKAFRTKRLNGVDNCKHAKLRTKRGETWNVKMRSDDEEMWLDKGWKEFVKDNEVSLGDFLVFEHKGNMVFDVLLFDPSACEKEYWSTSKKNTAANHKITTFIKQDPLKEAEAYKTSRPHFIKRITPHSLSKNNPQMDVPISFARSNGLIRKGIEATLRGPRMKNPHDLDLAVRYEPQARVRFRSGMLHFFKANDIRVGDVCVFELDPIAKKKGKIAFYVKVFRG